MKSECVKMKKNCNDVAPAGAYEIREIQKASGRKDMFRMNILYIHISRTMVTC